MAILDFLSWRNSSNVSVDKHAFSQLKDALSRLPEQQPIKIYGNRTVHTEHSIYENIFPFARPQIDLAKNILPEIEDARGDKYDLDDIKLPQAFRVLSQSPNSDMDFYEFIDTAYTAYLSLSEVAILVNFSDDSHSLDNVGGYQFLPLGSRKKDRQSGEVYYEYNDGWDNVRRSSDDVTLLRYSRLPEDVDRGFSPGCAIRKWAAIDDYIADYERGFLENGAFLGVIVSIPAETPDEFNKKSDKLEEELQGAKNANKVVFIQKSPNINGDAQGLDFQIIQSTNQQLSLDQLDAMTTNRLRGNIGTPSIFMGDDGQATYANAEIAKETMIDSKIQPMLTAFWGKFGRELARVTKSAGWKFIAEIEAPESTDRQKTRAETENIKIGSLIQLIDAGVSGIAAVEALDLPDSYNTAAIQMARTPNIAIAEKQTAHACGGHSDVE